MKHFIFLFAIFLFASHPLFSQRKATDSSSVFSCDVSHTPYTYYKLWWDYSVLPDNTLTTMPSDFKLLAKLPAATSLKLINFDDLQVYSLITGKVDRKAVGDDAGGKSFTLNETRFLNFPPSIKKNSTDMASKGLVVVQTTKNLVYTPIPAEELTDETLLEKFSRETKSMAPELLKTYPYKDENSQKNFKNDMGKPIGEAQKLSIPGLECYVLRKGNKGMNGMVFISINNKMQLLTSDFYKLSDITAYKLNNNYFVFLNGYFLEIFEIRNTGVRNEWKGK